MGISSDPRGAHGLVASPKVRASCLPQSRLNGPEPSGNRSRVLQWQLDTSGTPNLNRRWATELYGEMSLLDTSGRLDSSLNEAEHPCVESCRWGLVMQRLDFRRGPASNTWHWNPNCPNWPNIVFECVRSPASGVRCQACAHCECLAPS